MAVLCLLDDDGTMADRWEVSGRPLAIGRDESAEVVINDDTLSRRHFLIWMQGGKYFLKDLNSQNGTAVDGKLMRETVLRHNDCIRAGRTLFLFNEHGISARFGGFEADQRRSKPEYWRLDNFRRAESGFCRSNSITVEEGSSKFSVTFAGFCFCRG